MAASHDPDDSAPTLLVPEERDPAPPEVSIVVPALDEALTIGDFVDWCKEGLARAKVSGEILIVDSSTDETKAIALAHGARVLQTPRRGLGRAYIDSVPFIRGKYVILGDADCTYDFRELEPFVARFREGYEYVMGSRFDGYIEPGAMPPLHRYLGTPLTTWILNVIFSSHFPDIHCGMRGITLEALKRMRLRSQSWDYASEMVVKSVHMGLKTGEVPIRFLKDRPGRLSHHRRAGWLSPWAAAWLNLRAMFVYGAAFFLYRPGIVLTALGLLLTLPVTFGPVTLGPVVFSLHWMLFGLTLTTLGLQSTYMGILAQVFFDYSGAITKRWLRRFPYNRSVAVAAALFVVGLAFGSTLIASYVRHGLRLTMDSPANYAGVTGVLFMIAGFSTFTFTLLLHAATAVVGRKD
jgi:hypothetical protein